MDTNELIEAMEQVAEQRLSLIHTALPATVISFDATTCAASVRPALTYYRSDGNTLDYPVITGVPVFMPRAGEARITYPVKKGDSCLLIFSERALDEWLNKTEEHDPRRFDLTDACCFVGMCPAQSISSENVELINGGTAISLTPDKTVNITGDVNITGKVTVSGDVTAGGISLISHTHTCPDGVTSAPN